MLLVRTVYLLELLEHHVFFIYTISVVMFFLSLLCCLEVGKLLQVQNGTPPSTNYNGVDAVHACNILQQLKALYDEAQLTDIVVEVDHGMTFSCHRNVLAAISPYFR